MDDCVESRASSANKHMNEEGHEKMKTEWDDNKGGSAASFEFRSSGLQTFKFFARVRWFLITLLAFHSEINLINVIECKSP